MKEEIKLFARRHPALLNVYRGTRYSFAKGRVRELFHRLSAGHFIRKSKINRFLGSTDPRYLQVGGGYHVKNGKGWLNGDIIGGDIYLNAVLQLPFPDDSVDRIFTEQFIEHLPQPGAQGFMEEAFRVLKPGGILRQSTPDLEKLIQVYEDRNAGASFETVMERHLNTHRKEVPWVQRTKCQFINDYFRLWGHQYIYDKRSLRDITEKCGFIEFQWTSFGESSEQDMKGLDRHADTEWMKNSLSMFCEAKKPPNQRLREASTT